MSSTINFIGIGGTEKPSRVLRQPGGGSSIIFGEEVQTPRTVKNHMQSNIFSTEKSGDQPRRIQKNADSYTRLFGEVNSQPQTPAKNHMKSSILPESPSNRHCDHLRDRNGSVSSASSSVSSSSENLKINGISKTGDNSVTNKGSTVNNGTNHVINKNRVPPGGFSSGLW